MRRFMRVVVLCVFMTSFHTAWATDPPAANVISTAAGDLTITFIGHGSLIFGFRDKTIHVDPYGKLADYSALPKADYPMTGR